ncbi:isocitrate lyase/phosphoenolpyruvate mutase family protein [Bradyrhizobium sp. SZCCHNRI20481]|uniref:isocitrate lyase/phosphoenolpyruvate mutase family protein n=1 Tax=Bradyrhizobium sp. SZCCHNRI20481 TaxID=3057286 RepID=UPI002915EF59|nr:isocitrate lyase/phosphoenolpyruvate mutase family protein [Bradyrhizobium sp. SZCCHNRI20481]
MTTEHMKPGQKLVDLLRSRGMRFIEVHSGLSTLIACRARSLRTGRGFDGLWVSSLTCSASVGVPDLEMIGIDRRLDTIQQIAAMADLPILVDGDTGGSLSSLRYLCTTLRRAGVGGVVFEEKTGEKRNSLDAPDQKLAPPEEFAARIRAAVDMVSADELMVFARLEGYNASLATREIVERAALYVEAGASGIFIHSKSKQSDQVLDFARTFRALGYKVPIICVPTTFYATTASQLFEGGLSGVIYANQQLRAAAAAMTETCGAILENDGVFELENTIMPTKQIFDLVGYTLEISRVEKLARGADGLAPSLNS